MYRAKSVLFASVFAAFVGNTGCATNAAHAGDVEIVARASESLSASSVNQVTVTITGGAIQTPITSDLTLSTDGTKWMGNLAGIPSGSGLLVHANAVDVNGLSLYSGDATGVTVGDSSPTLVAMILQQSDPSPAFTDTAPVIDSVTASTNIVAPGGQVSLQVNAHDTNGDALTYAWTATDGSFDDPTNSSPTWTAPPTTETVTISVTVSDVSGTSTGINFQVNVSSTGSINIVATFNTWPTVTLVSANPTRLDPQGGATILTATANDADGNALTYAWTSDCDGSFAAASSATTQFNLNTPPASGACTFTVIASDGQGGTGQGSLQLDVASAPPVVVSPIVDTTSQSLPQADGGQTVALQVQAHDPQNGQLYYFWTSDVGDISGEIDAQGTSSVSWTAPGTFNGSATVTVYISDDAGASTSYAFTIWSTGTQCTTCSSVKHPLAAR